MIFKVLFQFLSKYNKSEAKSSIFRHFFNEIFLFPNC